MFEGISPAELLASKLLSVISERDKRTRSRENVEARDISIENITKKINQPFYNEQKASQKTQSKKKRYVQKKRETEAQRKIN